MDRLLARLSESLGQAHSQEALVRPLLEMLQQVTQLESTYLTTIDFDNGVQQVRYALNTEGMQIPEGLSVPWNDTLCQRALAEKRMCTSDVQAYWGDSQAAQALGIQTYVSAPITLSDGRIYGTLCAASGQRTHLPQTVEVVLQLFAQLVGQHVEREQLMAQLQERNAQLTQLALTDPLTQLPNRAALMEALQRLLAQALREGSHVIVAFVDLDGFKHVNDVYGHATGDALLCTLAQRLQSTMRASDMVARMGGDEFVLVGPAAAPNDALPDAIDAIRQRLREASVCDVVLPNQYLLHYSGASVGVVAVNGDVTVDAALQWADAAMYADKALRKGQPQMMQ
jgi:diguanylate cyclase